MGTQARADKWDAVGATARVRWRGVALCEGRAGITRACVCVCVCVYDVLPVSVPCFCVMPSARDITITSVCCGCGTSCSIQGWGRGRVVRVWACEGVAEAAVGRGEGRARGAGQGRPLWSVCGPGSRPVPGVAHGVLSADWPVRATPRSSGPGASSATKAGRTG